jgi:hypothetical protein
MARLVLIDSKKPKPNTQLGLHRASASEGEAARRLLEEQGYPVKRIANKQFETRCPMHEGPGEVERNKGTNFYVHAESGLYWCHSASCGERGNLQTLERFFGVGQDDSWVQQFRSREEQLREFERCLVQSLRVPFYQHGLTDQTIERFRLGYEAEHVDEQGKRIAARYVIPYLEGRRPRFFRYYRPDTGQSDYDPRWKYTWEEGAQSTLFNAQDAIGDDKEGRVFLCEGELKCALLVQLGYAAVAVPGAGQWKDEFQAAFTHARHIFVCYDNDNPEHHIYDNKPNPGDKCRKCAGKGLDRCLGHNPGKEAALARVEQLGWRAKNVLLPLPGDVRKTDINDFFMRDGHTNADFAELATGKRATPFKVQSLAEITAAPPEEAVFLIEQGILPKNGRLLVAGKPKIGKCQPLSTPVLTPDGWSTMGALQPGDQVIGSDGTPAKVTHIHPQGVVPIYRVTMSDGSSTECGADHLWTIQNHYDRTTGKPGRTVETAAIAQMLADGRTRDTHIPMVAPIQYSPTGELPLDPYGLGLLLGSGSLVGGTPTVTSTSSELKDALIRAFPQLRPSVAQNGTVTLTAARGKTANPLTTVLRELNLWGLRTWEKFIPRPYLRAGVADRVALLHGLMDSSGWVQTNTFGNTSVLVATSSEALKDDVVELLESLGGLARVQHKPRPKHQNGVGRPSWTITVRLPQVLEPFRQPGKLESWRSGRTSKNTAPLRRIVSVDYVRDDEAQCITIDRADGLYVTERFILTHNSIFVDNLALSLSAGIPFLKRFKVDHPTRTLLLDRELSKWSLFSRLNHLMDDRPGYKAATENLLIDHDHLLRLDQANALDILLQLVEQNGAEVVILDTAYKFFGGDVESSSSLMRGFEVLDKVMHQTGCSFVMTHHLKKGQGGKAKENNDVADPDAVAGSFLWTGWPNATILLNYLHRSVENPFNATCTFTAFRDHAAPEPLALYRTRESIAYSAIQDYSHEDSPSPRAPMESLKPSTESVSLLLLEMCPTTEDDFLHVASARFGISINTLKPYYLDAISSGHFEKTNGRPPIVKYKYAEQEDSWEKEHGLAERPAPEHLGVGFENVDMFEAANLA